MSAAIDFAMDLAGEVHVKLWAEAARPNSKLRILVGHSNLLGLLMVDLTDIGQFPETQTRRRPDAEAERDSTSKFVENFDEHAYYYPAVRDYDSDSESTSDSDYSSDSSDQDDSASTDSGVAHVNLTADAIISPFKTLSVSQTPASNSLVTKQETEVDELSELDCVRAPRSMHSRCWSPSIELGCNSRIELTTLQAILATAPHEDGIVRSEILAQQQDALDPRGPPPRNQARLAANKKNTSNNDGALLQNGQSPSMVDSSVLNLH